MRAVLDRWEERVRAACAARRALKPRGGGTKDFYGNACDAEEFDTSEFAGIVAYEPSELVLTARCGTRLADIEARLAEHGQMLAFEPPHYGPAATLGGCIAAGLSGPRRARSGALRDFVLGARLLDGRSRRLAFGGRVMKNVAGYDVSRLLAGSLGTLGVILEVSLKVLPRPASECTLCFELAQAAAIDRMNRWAAQPLPISATAWKERRLFIRMSGAAPALESARRKLGGELVASEQGRALWEAIREHAAPFFGGAAQLWRLSVPDAAPPIALPGEWLLEWNGGLRWLAGEPDVRSVREAASWARGHATLFRSAEKKAPVFTHLGAAEMRLMTALKRAFDPAGIFSPGRLYPGL